MKKGTKAVATVRVLMEAEVARQVRQHGRSSMKAEVCGILIGREEGHVTIVDACIAGTNAAQGGAHVTFTQDTWQHIYEVKDKKYPDARIVGWYHSHPGFGVFLSDHDLFIHKNFFSSPQQIAWVYDPHTDEEGCFGWLGERVEKIDDVSFRYLEACGDSGAAREDDGDDETIKVVARNSRREEEGFWMPLLREAALAAAFLVIGGFGAFYYITSRAVLLPRDASGLVLVDQGQMTVVPPEIANQILGILKAQMDAAMKSGQLPPGASPALQPGGGQSSGQQGGTDVRKK
ncbi:MAG: Mov34/MPN/PAD-1 family protein [Terriglobales bacterium]